MNIHKVVQDYIGIQEIPLLDINKHGIALHYIPEIKATFSSLSREQRVKIIALQVFKANYRIRIEINNRVYVSIFIDHDCLESEFSYIKEDLNSITKEIQEIV